MIAAKQTHSIANTTQLHAQTMEWNKLKMIDFIRIQWIFNLSDSYLHV